MESRFPRYPLFFRIAASFPRTDTPPRFPRRASAEAAEPALAVAATDGTSASCPVAPLRDDILSRSLRNRSGRALLPKKLCYTSNILPKINLQALRLSSARQINVPRRNIKTVFSACGMAPGSDRHVKAACRTSRTAPRASLRKEFCQFSRSGFRPYRA